MKAVFERNDRRMNARVVLAAFDHRRWHWRGDHTAGRVTLMDVFGSHDPFDVQRRLLESQSFGDGLTDAPQALLIVFAQIDNPFSTRQVSGQLFATRKLPFQGTPLFELAKQLFVA